MKQAGQLIKNDARNLTIDLSKHSNDYDILQRELTAVGNLNRLTISLNSPSEVFSYIPTVTELIVQDESSNDNTPNLMPIFPLSNIQKLRIKLGASCPGNVYSNLRFPSITMFELHQSDNNVQNWIECLEMSYCIEEMRCHCDTACILQIPGHVAGSVSRLVFAPHDVAKSYALMDKIVSKFPYLDSLSLFTNHNQDLGVAKQAARLVKMKNPAVEVSYFDKHTDYFGIKEKALCTCNRHCRESDTAGSVIQQRRVSTGKVIVRA